MPRKKADDVAAALTKKRPKRNDPITDNDLLKTGSTMLDLALSGRRAGGFAKGKYFWVAGDSTSGKTFLAMTCMAEASINKNFDNYRFIFDDVEGGALMDMERYFGPRMANRLEPPQYADDGEAVHSATIEDFYHHLDDALQVAEEGGQPFIYVLDSMDALGSKYSDQKFEEGKKAARGGKEAKGDYGDGKAKINSTYIRRVNSRLRRTGCILIVISQVRDNVGGGMFEEQKITAGGHALKFYATVQVWSSVGSKIKGTINGKDIQIGVHCRITTKKNRMNGKNRTIQFPIYYDVGIDDIGGMVDFLTEWKFWKKSGGFIDATKHFEDVKLRREALIQWVEENDARTDLEDIVEEAWNKMEEKIAVKRKNKYDE